MPSNHKDLIHEGLKSSLAYLHHLLLENRLPSASELGRKGRCLRGSHGPAVWKGQRSCYLSSLLERLFGILSYCTYTSLFSCLHSGNRKSDQFIWSYDQTPADPQFWWAFLVPFRCGHPPSLLGRVHTNSHSLLQIPTSLPIPAFPRESGSY